MRKALLLVWLLIPVVVGAYHYGPGQEKLVLDEVTRALRQADKHAADAEWSQAVALYDDVLNRLPDDRIAAARRVRLERAKAWMFVKKLPDAHEDLLQLVDEMEADPRADAATLTQAREALANAKYYVTWLMRLEGQPREAWEPEIEASRQTFRLLAEQALAANDGEQLQRHRENLESSIRLARLDLSDLQGLPLPSQ